MQSTCKIALVALTVAAVSTGFAQTAPEGTSTLPSQPPGSTIVTQVKSTGSYGSATTQWTLTRLPRQTWQGKEVFPTRLPDGSDLLITKDGGWVAIIKGDTPVVSYDTPMGYPFPLKVGTTATVKSNMTVHAKNQVVPVEVRFTVEAYEDVATPAGTFKAFRIRSVDNAGNDNLNWYNVDMATHLKQKQTRLPQHSSGPGTRESELISYTPGK